MKLIYKILIIILVTLFGFTINSNAQIFKGEVISGINFTQVDGDELFGYKKVGFTGGLGVVTHITPNFTISLETLFSQKGSRQNRNVDSLGGKYLLRLNYTEVPIILQYTDKKIASIGLGVSWNRLVGLEEYRNKQIVDTVFLNSGVFDKNDWMGLVDFRLRVYKNFIGNVRFSYSMKKIATRYIRDSEYGGMNWRDWYNNVWTFRLIYMINEQAPDRKPAKKVIRDL